MSPLRIFFNSVVGITGNDSPGIKGADSSKPSPLPPLAPSPSVDCWGDFSHKHYSLLHPKLSEFRSTMAPPSTSSPSRVPEKHERGSPVSNTCRRYRPHADSRSLQTPTPRPLQLPLWAPYPRSEFPCWPPACPHNCLAPPWLEPLSHRPRLGLPLRPLLAMPGPRSLLCHTVWAIPTNSRPAREDISTSGPTWACLSDSSTARAHISILAEPEHISSLALPGHLLSTLAPPEHVFPFWPRPGTSLLWPCLGTYCPLCHPPPPPPRATLVA